MDNVDRIYNFEWGKPSKHYSQEPGKTRLRIFWGTQNYALVILTELPDNQGPSVTEHMAALASKLVSEYKFEPARTTWVGNHSEQTGPGAGPETFELKTFTWKKGQVLEEVSKGTNREEVNALLRAIGATGQV